MNSDLALGLSLFLTALAAAIAASGVLYLLASRHGRTPSPLFSDLSKETVFLFDGETLIDASPRGRKLLHASPGRGGPWQRLMVFLAPHFPGVDRQLAGLAREGRIVRTAGSGGTVRPITIVAEWCGGLTRIVLADPEADPNGTAIDPLTQRANEEELQLLRGTVAQAPLPIWLENSEGEVIWANSPYVTLATERLGAEAAIVWPLPRILAVGRSVAEGGRQRIALTTPDQADRWFDAVVRNAGEGRMIFAQPIDPLVQTERALAEFRQTLTKTFAQLPIGLAIFDRARQLALFNPALGELTGLPPEFLAGRPSLFDFLDRLRDARMIPEPQDYAAWRSQMLALEQAAASGQYEELWSLPGGQTYRVIGRPHPDGAVALLFEDLSTEISRTRRYRDDVELGHAVIDAMDEAVAVFSSAGQLVLCNQAYVSLWQHDPVGTLETAGIAGLAVVWRSRCAPSSIWTRIEEYVATLTDRDPWVDGIRLRDGRPLLCRAQPLIGGATLISFRLQPQEAVLPEPATLPAFQTA